MVDFVKKMAGILSKGIPSKVKTLLTGVIGSSNTAEIKQARDNFGSGLTIAVTIALQYGLEKGVFKCPETNHYYYGMLFLLTPMIPLYSLSVISTKEFTRSLQGFCASCHVRGKHVMHRTRYILRTSLLLFTKCVLAPVTWLTMALMQKNMYTCAMVGPSKVIGGTNKTTVEYERLREKAEAESQILGWLLLMTGVCITCIGFTFQKCFTKQVIEPKCIELEALDTYPAYEADSARDYFEFLMKDAAIENGRRRVDTLLEIERQEFPPVKCDDQNRKHLFIPPQKIEDARKVMIRMYPRLQNPLDESLDWYDHDWNKYPELKSKLLSAKMLANLTCLLSGTGNDMFKEGHAKNENDQSTDPTNVLHGETILLRQMSSASSSDDEAMTTPIMQRDV